MGSSVTDYDEVSQLLERGLAENWAGRPRQAVRHLRAALHRLGPRSVQVEDATARWLMSRTRVLLAMARSQVELGGSELGLKLLADAEADATEAGDPSIRTALHKERGVLYLRTGRMDEALAEFDRGERWFADAPALDRCNVLLNRGVVRMERTEIDLARADLSRCLDLATTEHLDILRSMALHNLGYVEYLAGNLPLALTLTSSSGAAGAGASVAVSLLDHARILAVSGLTREVEVTLLQARQLFDDNRVFQDRAEVDLELASTALQAGDLAAARRYALKATEVFRRRRNVRWRRRAVLLVLQIDLRGGRNLRRVANRASELATELAADGQSAEARSARFVQAEALLELGEVQAAARVAESAGPATPEDPITSRLQTFYLQARLRLARGQRSEASAQVRLGLDEVADYQAHFGSVDLRTASASHGEKLQEMGVRIALDVGRPESLFNAIERGRSNSARMPAVRPAHDEITASLLTELRKTVDVLRASEPSSGEHHTQQRRRTDLERRISQRSWSLPGSASAPAPAELPEVQSALGVYDTQLVDFVSVDGVMHALRLSSRACESLVLGASAPIVALVRKVRADLDLLAYNRIPAGLRQSARSSLARSLRDLDDLLLRPLRLDGHRVTIAPSPVLLGLPWGALPSRVETPTSVTRSGTSWLRGLPRPGSVASTRPLDVRVLAGPDLARADEEVAAISTAWAGSTALTGSAATRRAFASAYTDAQVVHAAAHGQHQVQNPLFSSFRLADGLLFAYELDRSERAAPHVVLSACDLGLATVRPGDEWLGLTSALLQLGTRSVVSGVARVSDEVAAAAMVAYHRRLALGEDSALALAIAVHSVAGPDVAPAPFVCFGSHWSPLTAGRVESQVIRPRAAGSSPGVVAAPGLA